MKYPKLVDCVQIMYCKQSQHQNQVKLSIFLSSKHYLGKSFNFSKWNKLGSLNVLKLFTGVRLCDIVRIQLSIKQNLKDH